MPTAHRVYILCLGISDEGLTELNDDYINRLQKAANKRKSQLQSDIYAVGTKMLLESETLLNKKFHMTCYNRFTAVRIYKQPRNLTIEPSEPLKTRR